jgi:hypothetical protein
MFGHYENEKKAAGVKTTTTTTRRSRSTQMRQKDVWQDGYKLRYEKNITLCSAPACGTRKAHEQHQRPLLRIHNPYGIARVRSSTIRFMVEISDQFGGETKPT